MVVVAAAVAAALVAIAVVVAAAAAFASWKPLLAAAATHFDIAGADVAVLEAVGLSNETDAGKIDAVERTAGALERQGSAAPSAVALIAVVPAVVAEAADSFAVADCGR